MLSLAIALGLGVSAAAGSVWLQLKVRDLRKKRLASLELRPNCLLTRHPILFVSQHRSLFRLFEHWNDIPGFLREHGYEVSVLEIPSKQDVASCVLAALQSSKQPGFNKFHLVGDSSLEESFKTLAEEKNPRIASLTLAQNSSALAQRTRRFKSSPGSPSPADLKPLPSAIETWIVDAGLISQAAHRVQSDSRHWVNFVSLALLRAHNLAGWGRRPRVDAVEIGQILFKDWQIEWRYLDLAISLAEKDAQWSD